MLGAGCEDCEACDPSEPEGDGAVTVSLCRISTQSPSGGSSARPDDPERAAIDVEDGQAPAIGGDDQIRAAEAQLRGPGGTDDRHVLAGDGGQDDDSTRTSRSTRRWLAWRTTVRSAANGEATSSVDMKRRSLGDDQNGVGMLGARLDVGQHSADAGVKAVRGALPDAVTTAQRPIRSIGRAAE